MALQSLKEKLLQAKKQAAANSSVARSKQIDTSHKPSALDNMTLQVQKQNTKLAMHIAKQEETGVYDFNSKIDDIEGFDAHSFINSMKMLDQAVVEKTPDIRTFSVQIRRNLQQYPELTHLLKDEQLHILVSGMLHLAGVETAPKKKGSKKATYQNVTKEDLDNLDYDDM